VHFSGDLSARHRKNVVPCLKDPDGRAGWISFLRNGGTLEALETDSLVAPEYINHINTHINTDYVQSLYISILGRTGSSDELALWNNSIQELGLAGISNGFTNSTENRINAVRTYFEAYLHRTPSDSEVISVASVPGDLLSLEILVLSSPEFFMTARARWGARFSRQLPAVRLAFFSEPAYSCASIPVHGWKTLAMVTAPPVVHFPAFPATWYLFGASRELRTRPVSRDMLGRRLVAFRTKSGRLAVLDARCAHLGADLGCGTLAGETIRCPFHHWQYAADGRCFRVPGTRVVPEFAAQRSYPAVERHGYVFFFNGASPLFPLPFFFGCRTEHFVAGRPFRFVADCSWFMLAANGFDAAHFETVHDRTLMGPPRVDCPAAFARRMRYSARVTGNSLFDRLIRRFLGENVEVSITSWGGPFVLVTGFFQRARSYILIAAQPREDGRTDVQVIVFARRLNNPVARTALSSLSLGLRRWFTRGFMQDDIDRLGGVRYNPRTLIANDQLLVDFFHWLTALPQSLEHASEAHPSQSYFADLCTGRTT
jgi:nitrite reductase/ring-hydroxylating ferredoxin subunit